MSLNSTSPLDPIAAFGEKLAASLADGTFVRLVLSSRTSPEAGPDRILARGIDLRGQPHLSLTFRYPTRDEVQNLPVTQAVEWILKRIGPELGSALLCTTRNDWQLTVRHDRPAHLIRHQPSCTVTPARQHDRTHRSLLDDSARDWLAGLGVTDATGRVRATMADKYVQIGRYLEILSHLVKDSGWADPGLGSSQAGPWQLADMGCGKGYLTFGLWHLFRRIWKLPVRVIGVEARPELVEGNNRLAQQIKADGLEFVSGTIENVELPVLHGLIALHACNTATDEAILRGIRAGAEFIVVAPCCHQQVRPQMTGPAVLRPVLRHGILEERMAEWVTDGLRALFLEWAGYQTKVFEFVASDHTPKNLMISAVRPREPFRNPAARQRLLDLKTFFGIQTHPLDVLLATP